MELRKELRNNADKYSFSGHRDGTVRNLWKDVQQVNICTLYRMLGFNEQTMRKKFKGISSCGNCRWHYHEDIDDGYMCVNAESNRCADWTDDTDFCEAWEGKE